MTDISTILAFGAGGYGGDSSDSDLVVANDGALMNDDSSSCSDTDFNMGNTVNEVDLIYLTASTLSSCFEGAKVDQLTGLMR